MIKKLSKMVKNPKIPKNLINSQKFTSFQTNFFFYPFSFPILGGRDSTRPLQSSPFQKYKNLKKSQKITYFHFFLEKKICYSLIFGN